MSGAKLSHLDAAGKAQMVDISDKAITTRRAVAAGKITITAETKALIESGGTPKGDVFSTARIAAIQAAKRTADIIPLCHPLPISGITCDFDMADTHIGVTFSVKTTGQTGVEMEALTGCTAALLTLYDMLKAVDKSMVLSGICLMEKTGGKGGDYRRDEA